MNLNNVLVVGMGKSGIAAAEALLDIHGKISIYDKREKSDFDQEFLSKITDAGGRLFLGTEPASDEAFSLVVVSPGVSLEQPFIGNAEKHGAEIIGELELAYRLGKGTYIAITGTNGKTTTTTLVGEIFKNAGNKTEVVGNLGVPVVTKVKEANDDTYFVSEVSSFQLDTTVDFKPHIAALLNITPDHLDRHGTFENYAMAKAKIYANQTSNDFFIVNADDIEATNYSKDCIAQIIPFSRKKELEFGCFVEDGDIVVRDKDWDITILAVEDLQIPGSHNLENALAATAICYFAGIAPDVIGRTLKTFAGVEHRLEYVTTIQGIRFVNDSKGTNPNASIKAIEAIDGGIILIAGGYDKGSNFEELINAFQNKVNYLVLFGDTAEHIRETAINLGFENIIMAKNMEECVMKSFAVAKSGNTVLLSPASASWDMYSCFEERGIHFKKVIAKLAIDQGKGM